MMMTALIMSVLATVPAVDDQVIDPGPFAVNAYLCESAEYAMDFAAAVAGNAEEEYAKNLVGKIAQREVCGRYIGVASIQEQKVVANDGIMYRLTALRFREDHRVAWAAERVFAVDGHASSWHL